MILVFGGTTEGRGAIEALDEGSGHYLYSTLGDNQQVECGHGIHISGPMTESSMTDICHGNNIQVIIDAAHPFASNLHNTVHTVATRLRIPVIRFERRYPVIRSDQVLWCEDYDEAVRLMTEHNIKRLLALTGVKTIGRLAEFWHNHNNETWFRVLPRDESIECARMVGFPENHLVFYDDNDNTGQLIDEISPDAIITKESGISGGFIEKVSIAIEKGLKVFVVRRPKLPDSFITVDGPHGLRMEIERLLPDFYPLHTGFTTGSCATAAAKAALIGLVYGEKPDTISFKIPEGETLRMDIESIDIHALSASATVIKIAGDDPDVTNHSRITANVAYASHEGIHFIGGEGIGTVTLPGIGLPVGSPAINPVPRAMIEAELSPIYSDGLDVTISLENGEDLAQKTFNPRVGVIGGVSIIGTSGIVRPFSHEAFIDAIRREMEVAIAVGCDRIVINSGGKSERYMKTMYPDLPDQAFIQYGNAIGDTMHIAQDLGISHLTIGLMIGKAVKLADGNYDTHSHKVTLDREFLINVASDNGCSGHAVDTIRRLSLARELWNNLPADDADRFFPALLRLCHRQCKQIYSGNLESVLIDDSGNIRYMTK